MTDIGKARTVIGREVADIKFENNKEVWLDFKDGTRMVFQVKDRGQGTIYSEEFRIWVDNEVVHQHRLAEIDFKNFRQPH